jgi:hypothetical protein
MIGIGAEASAAQSPQGCNLLCLSGQAREAFNARRYADYLRLALDIAERAPRHPGGAHAVARAYSLMGQGDSALAWLARLADIGGAHAVGSDSAFADLKGLAAYAAVEHRLEENGTPVTRGEPAFSVPDPDLVPEALTWDSSHRRWLIGSLAKRKVVSRTTDGTWIDFIAGRSEMLRVVGIHADSARNALWFATWEPTGDPDRFARTRLFKSDLATGRVRKTYAPADSAISHLFNDLAIALNGDVYVTDTQTGWVYRVPALGDSLEILVQPDPGLFSGANGIALTDDQRTLYVAFIEGVAKIDIASRDVTLLPTPPGVSTSGIDGLYWYEGDLIAVQNAPGLERVIRLRLDDSGGRITAGDILERGRDLLQVPTTGAILGSQFFYIANSQAGRLTSDNTLSPAQSSPARLSTVRVIDLALTTR